MVMMRKTWNDENMNASANPLDIIEDLILRFRREYVRRRYWSIARRAPSCPLRTLTSDFALDAMAV